MEDATHGTGRERRETSRLRGFLVSTVTLLVLALGLELTLRIAGYEPLAAMTRGRLRVIRASEHPDLAYELTPGMDEVFRGADLYVNRLGFRGREYEVPKPAGVLRVVVLGDSIAFADRMNVEDRLSERLESLAAEEGLAVEAPNLGVSGYDVIDAVASLEHLGLELEPDAVVYVLCVNDLGVQSFNLPLIHAVESLGPLGQSSRIVQLLTRSEHRRRGAALYKALASEEGFADHFAPFIAPIGDEDPVRAEMDRLRGWLDDRNEPFPYLPWYASEVRVGRLRYGLERLGRLATRHGFRAYVGLVPYLNDRGQPLGWELAYRIVAAEVERAGLESVDFVTAFRESGMLELFARPGKAPDPLHPNAAGHERMARCLLTEVVEAR